jgi:hypothetical protein
VSLCDANAGESLLLLNFEHLALASPYRSRYAICFRENAVEALLTVSDIPEVIQHRPFTIRAFDKAVMLIDADLAQGANIAEKITRLLENQQAAYRAAQNAKHGYFAARISRA